MGVRTQVTQVHDPEMTGPLWSPLAVTSCRRRVGGRGCPSPARGRDEEGLSVYGVRPRDINRSVLWFPEQVGKRSCPS